MPDTKITALTAISTVNPATYPLPIVDTADTTMAASGTTKKITVNQILGAGGTATLASATISGDLTVATNGLKVDSANKNVGINTATPTNTAGYKTLEIVGTGVNTAGMLRFKSSDTSVNTLDFADSNGRAIFAISNHPVRFGCNDIEQYRINPLGVFTWFDGAGGTRMTLNATGLGVGVSPSFKGHFYSASGSNGVRLQTGSTTAGDTNRLSFQNASGAADARTGCIEWYDVGTFKGDIRLLKAGGIQIRNSADSPTLNLDDTGNLGIGVVPSAWWVGFKAVESSNGVALLAQTNVPYCHLVSNAYDGAASFKYKVSSNYALRYAQDATTGNHIWFNAGLGTAGNAITFAQAMTLNANGALALQGGNTSANGVGITFPATQVASSDANTLDDYEEGSWTPTLNAGTFSAASCRYTKVGNMVTVFFDLTVGTGGGSQITNLPFTAASTSTVSSGIYTNNQTYAAGTTAPVAVIGGSSTTLFFRTVGSGVAFSAMSLTAGANLTGSISYFV